MTEPARQSSKAASWVSREAGPAGRRLQLASLISTLVTIPKKTAFLSSLNYLSYFHMVYPLFLLVLGHGSGLGAGPPTPHVDERVEVRVLP